MRGLVQSPCSPTRAPRLRTVRVRRSVQALVDHDWLSLVLEGWQHCGLCSGISFCY
jgi:hypothetical protein